MNIHKPPSSRWQKNTWKLAVMKLARSMLLIIPVIALYFTEYGLTLTQITLLQSIFSIAYFLLEIPTGYIADRYGRKTSIIVGTIIVVLSYLFYWTGSTFRSFAVAEIIMAVGLTCISGSDSALLYDTLKKAGKEKAAKKREGRLHFAGDIAGVVSGAVAGFIGFYYGFNVLRLISAVIVGITIPIAFSLEEINQKKETNKVFNTRKDFSEIITTLNTQPRILWLILYTGIIGYATYSLVRSQQQWLEELGAPIAWFGVIWGILRMSVAGAGLGAHKYDERLGHMKSLLGLLIGIIISFIIIASGIHRIIVFLGLLIAFSIRGLGSPLSTYYLNEQIGSNLRATTLSVNSMIHRIIYAIALPLQGLLGDAIGLQNMFIVMTILLAIFGGISRFKLYKTTKMSTYEK